MKNAEEKLWDYIDGNCSAEEHKAINALMAIDEAFRLKYQELLALNQEFSAMELDEPPMAFAYNVMEAIRTENAQQPLKAAINKRLIKGITLFFIATISVLLLYMLANMSWNSGNITFAAPVSFKMPDFKSYITKPVIQGFLFFDTILALFLADAYLRKKKIQKQAS
jgi:anti-sigma factor RsiW